MCFMVFLIVLASWSLPGGALLVHYAMLNGLFEFNMESATDMAQISPKLHGYMAKCGGSVGL